MGHKTVKLDNEGRILLNEVRALILNKDVNKKITDNIAVKIALEYYKRKKGG